MTAPNAPVHVIGIISDTHGLVRPDVHTALAGVELILHAGDVGGDDVLDELTRKHKISRTTYFNWRGKYGGVSVSELKRMKELEAENAKLKRMYAELALENTAIKDVLNRKL